MVYETFFFVLLLSATKLGKTAYSPGQMNRTFPKGFLFGSATSSFQSEGAWNEDGKSESIWDHISHKHPEKFHARSNADISSDAYHHFETDVQIMKKLGLDFYRFSISWPRILPSSFPDRLNEVAVGKYNKFIDEMLKHNIKPVVSLYHWDLPQKLQEMGGWVNPYIVQWFTDYARVVFQLFGDRVKQWITVNEPREMCVEGYTMATNDASNVSGISEYICSRNVLLAHASVYHMYDEEFRPSQGGIIGMTLSSSFYFSSPENYEIAERAHDFQWGWFSHPIFAAEGNYPPAMKKRIDDNSAAQGFPRSRMPAFSPEEVEYIRGSADFYGLNHYSSSTICNDSSLMMKFRVPSYYDDMDATICQSSESESTVSSWMKVVPLGFYELLTKIRKQFNNPPLYVFENGFPSNGGLVDDDRIKYIRDYLSAMLDAIEEGSNVLGYTYWSMFDTFEWEIGYSERLGLYHVNMSDARRPRTPRKSAFVYQHILRTRTLDYDYEPDVNLNNN